MHKQMNQTLAKSIYDGPHMQTGTSRFFLYELALVILQLRNTAKDISFENYGCMGPVVH